MRIFFIGVLLIAAIALAYALFESPHEFSPDECKGCHAGMPQPGQKSPFPMTGRIRILCSRCHSKVVRGYSHPDEVTPVNAVVPADMPLSADRKITCATCHDIHSSYEWSKKVYLLRRPTEGIEFCSTCHEERPGEISHTSVLGYAHGAGTKYIPTNPEGELDKLSVQCISCHDSSLGRGDKIAGAGYWIHSKELAKFLGGHPIGISYADARMKDHQGYKPKEFISPAKLFNGKVGCGTCHDPYSMETNKLVMSNKGSKLCYKCHNR